VPRAGECPGRLTAAAEARREEQGEKVRAMGECYAAGPVAPCALAKMRVVTDPPPSSTQRPPRAACSGYEERKAQRRLSQRWRGARRGGLLLARPGRHGKTLLPPAAVELGAASSSRRHEEPPGAARPEGHPILARALGATSGRRHEGRANYLCLLRFSSFAKAGSFRRLEEIPVKRAVEEWAPGTQTGTGRDRRHADSVDFWREVSAAARTAIGSRARCSTRAS